MEVEIIGLNHTGEGIAKIDGKIIFVSKTIPQDIVEIENIKDYGNYAKATMKSIIKPSPNRIEIECPYYQKCGGCQLLGLNYQDQLSYKKEKVKNILEKYANLKVNPSIIKSQQYQYRNKIILQVKEGKIGLYETESNKLVPIKKCLLISSQMNHLITIMNDKLDLTEVKQIMLREINHKIMIVITGKIDKITVIKLLSNQVVSIYINESLIYGVPKLEETLQNYHYLISPKSFFQINKEQTINLYNQVKKYLGTNHQNILDLYCGTATIGIYVSEIAKKITGIELNPSSVKDAKENLKINHLNNIQIKQGDVGKTLTTKEKYDAIIVDPPRSGLDKLTKKTLLQLKSPKIIYVSCNPITLARDLKELQTHYQLQEITLFDMFPNTYHVETVCVLAMK